MKHTILLLAVLAVMSCSGKSAKDNPMLVEANEVHLAAEAIQEEIEPQIEKLDSLRNLLTMRKTPQADSVIADLATLKTDFEAWEKDFFPVPGFEHAHAGKHEHHHHHDHAPAPELPADKMLEVQKEIKKNIEGIQNRLSETLTKTRKILQ
ncbi:hypothetical protein [Emticicia sp. 17c]|uniref:hypothetical protein n=1 Tax=Emticicia sp. 17c TaxID=3127704 RepID=UPI00301C9F3B